MIDLVADILPAAASLLDQTSRIQESQAAEEHQHNPRVLPCDKVGILEAVDGFESDAELVDIPLDPLEGFLRLQTVDWSLSTAYYYVSLLANIIVKVRGEVGLVDRRCPVMPETCDHPLPRGILGQHFQVLGLQEDGDVAELPEPGLLDGGEDRLPYLRQCFRGQEVSQLLFPRHWIHPLRQTLHTSRRGIVATVVVTRGVMLDMCTAVALVDDGK